MRIKGTALRKIRDFFEWLIDIRPSRETIRQWTNEIGKEYKNDRTKTSGSGIYSYDEQYLNIDGKKHYRLCLKDVVTEKTVNERIVDDLTKHNIKRFIIDSLNGKEVSVIVTDGDPQYDNILKEVAREFGIDKILHQLCTFHALKNLSKAISKSVKSIKNRNLGYTTNYNDLKNSMKLIFNLDDEKMIEKYLNRLSKGHQKRFSEIIQNENESMKEKARTIFEYFNGRDYHKHISNQIDWMDKNWNKLTNFYQSKDIPKTNNAVEQHFSNTNPELVKRGFKNKDSLENHLFAIASYHNKKLSLKS
ncbi:MAG: transposase [Thermoplasmata archaeon]